MIVPTTPPWPRNLIPHKFSCQPRTRKFYPRNLIRIRYSHVASVYVTSIHIFTMISIGGCLWNVGGDKMSSHFVGTTDKFYLSVN